MKCYKIAHNIILGILKALDFESEDKQDTFEFFQHPLEVGKLVEFMLTL